MKAIVLAAFGGVEQLKVKNIKAPEPNQDEILVRVSYFSINQEDINLRKGMRLQGKVNLPLIPGWDISGKVEYAHSSSSYREGDRVMGLINFPAKGNAYSEYVLVNEDQIAKVPDSISLSEAAALPMSGLKALEVMANINVNEGDRVLILGADSGIGHLLIQMLIDKEVYTIGTGTLRNRDYLKSLGIDKYINSKDEDYELYLDDISLIVDAGDANLVERSMKVLNENGTFISCNEMPDERLFQNRGDIVRYEIEIESSAQMLQNLIDLVDTQQLKINVDKCFNFYEIGEAHKAFEEYDVRGKIVVSTESQIKEKIKIRLR